MKTVTDFPRKTTVVEGEFIALSDGVQLAVKIWMPEDAAHDPVPAIVEYLPYRYQDGTAERDALTHPYFAGHGYASVRVDMRGTGNSTGVLLGEYLKQEQDDALEVIDWITDQPWCSGQVGIIGISWGGFNGLQIAARKPDALKAIVTICSTDDRYADDIHFMGGAMLTDNIAWSTYMFSINTTPPDPLVHGDAWRDIWHERLKGSGLWLSDWLAHQQRDEFYRHGSVCENYDDIDCAVYAVGGWADGYSNSIFRLLSNLKAPCKGLIGPWAHLYPHFATPGPAIGFLHECLRWWDHWLKGGDTGIMDEPQLRCWMQDSVRPQTHYDYRPGRWIAESQWPSDNIEQRLYHLTGDGLSGQAGSEHVMRISSPQTAGRASGTWCSYGVDPDVSGDQRAEAGSSLNFDSLELSEELEILGAPVVRLKFNSSQRNALAAVCLNEVLVDGSVTRITYGILNLTHRNGHLDPENLIPGQDCSAVIQMNEIAHKFAAGSKIRLSLTTAYWPVVWPSPVKSELALLVPACTLTVPFRPRQEIDNGLAEFAEPEAAPALNKTVLSEPGSEFTVTENIQTGDVTLRKWFDEGIIVYDDYPGWTVASTHEEFFSIHPDDPCSAKCDITWTEKFSRGNWEVSTRTNTMVTSTPSHFHLQARLEAWEGDELAYEQTWNQQFERKFV
ncbi:MAG: CocE/NonD family hydrolase [Acidiferrobacterales bacterium]|nr:CocE/NonD family hydrolase [Acidiferrobacterales bacterium]